MRGLFVFVDVPAGTYAVVVERAGFKKAQVLDVQVNVDKPAILTVCIWKREALLKLFP